MNAVAAPEITNSSDSRHGFEASISAVSPGPPRYSLLTWKFHGT